MIGGRPASDLLWMSLQAFGPGVHCRNISYRSLDVECAWRQSQDGAEVAEGLPCSMTDGGDRVACRDAAAVQDVFNFRFELHSAMIDRFFEEDQRFDQLNAFGVKILQAHDASSLSFFAVWIKSIAFKSLRFMLRSWMPSLQMPFRFQRFS